LDLAQNDGDDEVIMEKEGQMIYIAFTGHRDRNTTREALDNIMHLHPGATWVHGGAIGFDTQVAEYARAHGIPTVVIRPDYKKFADRPKYAPLARNKEIVDMSMCLYACYDGRNVGGTKFTVNYAKEKGKLVYILPAVE
jgi:hypothetical protein